MDAAIARELSQAGPIVFYDGECGLCDRSVQALVKLDKTHRLRYATLQGETAARLLGPPEGDAGGWSIKLLDEGRVYDRSTAAIRAMTRAGGLGKLAGAMLIVPRVVRDGIYRWIATHRYRWFGDAEACLLPTQAIRQRFLP